MRCESWGKGLCASRGRRPLVTRRRQVNRWGLGARFCRFCANRCWLTAKADQFTDNCRRPTVVDDWPGTPPPLLQCPPPDPWGGALGTKSKTRRLRHRGKFSLYSNCCSVSATICVGHPPPPPRGGGTIMTVEGGGIGVAVASRCIRW